MFVNIGPYRAGNFKTLVLLQVSSDASQTLRGLWTTMVEYRLLISLAIGQIFGQRKNFWHFEILTLE